MNTNARKRLTASALRAHGRRLDSLDFSDLCGLEVVSVGDVVTTPEPEVTDSELLDYLDRLDNATERELRAAREMALVHREFMASDSPSSRNSVLRRYADADEELQKAKRAARRRVKVTVVRTYGRKSYIR